MAKNKIILRFSVITVLILLAALSRLIPHPANFAPIGGMALFGAAYYSKRYWAFIIPIVTMWISDLILNNVVYGEFFDGFVWGMVYEWGLCSYCTDGNVYVEEGADSQFAILGIGGVGDFLRGFEFRRMVFGNDVPEGFRRANGLLHRRSTVL